MVALTGIERASPQFSSVQVGLSVCIWVQLVRLGIPQTSPRFPRLSLGRHSPRTILRIAPPVRLAGANSFVARFRDAVSAELLPTRKAHWIVEVLSGVIGRLLMSFATLRARAIQYWPTGWLAYFL